MADGNLQRVLSRVASTQLIASARAVAGFRLARPEFGSAANVSGVRTRILTFSWRHDSRTMFASHVHYGYQRRAGAWTGSDKTAIAACRRVLRAAKIPAAEIAGIDIQRELGQIAERTSGDDFRVSEPTLLRKLAHARRSVRGIPVWSSYATVGLTAKGDIGSLELHWPELTEIVMREAGILNQLVKRGLRPPDLKGGRPESIEAGVIHSPSVGFFMDVVAVVRVIYVVEEPGIGRKPVLYLDRHGEQIDPPRSIRLAPPSATERAKPT